MSAREDWKVLKPQIGQFINTLDGLYKGAENIDEAIKKAEERGYKKGFQEGNVKACSDCARAKLFDKYNGHYAIFDKYLELSDTDRRIVYDMINALSNKK